MTLLPEPPPWRSSRSAGLARRGRPAGEGLPGQLLPERARASNALRRNVRGVLSRAMLRTDSRSYVGRLVFGIWAGRRPGRVPAQKASACGTTGPVTDGHDRPGANVVAPGKKPTEEEGKRDIP